MKVKLAFFLTFVLLLTAAISCSRKDEALDVPVLKHSINVIAELPDIAMNDDDVKGSLGSFVSAVWDEGDKVSIVNLTTGKTLGGELSSDRKGTVTTFSGSVSGTIRVGDVLALIYPSVEAVEETDFISMTGHLDHQVYDTDVPLIASGTFTADKVSGSFSGLKLVFTYGLSFLKLNMANLPPGTTVSQITIRNIPTDVTFTINSEKTGFDVSNSEEKAASSRIEVEGTFTVSHAGTLMVPVAVVPSDARTNRSVVVTVEGEGDYSSPLASQELTYHRYYNTVVAGFEKTGLPGVSEYGAYKLTGEVLDQYSESGTTLINGVGNGKADFTMLKASATTFWTVKGFPKDIEEGDTFTAGFASYGVGGFPASEISDAKVTRIDKDGDSYKLWVTAHTSESDYLFIIRN